jgi:hypothetical protein
VNPVLRSKAVPKSALTSGLRHCLRSVHAFVLFHHSNAMQLDTHENDCFLFDWLVPRPRLMAKGRSSSNSEHVLSVVLCWGAVTILQIKFWCDHSLASPTNTPRPHQHSTAHHTRAAVNTHHNTTKLQFWRLLFQVFSDQRTRQDTSTRPAWTCSSIVSRFSVLSFHSLLLCVRCVGV